MGYLVERPESSLPIPFEMVIDREPGPIVPWPYPYGVLLHDVLGLILAMNGGGTHVGFA